MKSVNNLYPNCISKELYSIIEDLNDEIEKLDFYLGGGTGLSLQLGHRRSIDLDFFTIKHFKPEKISIYLQHKYKNYKENSVFTRTLHCEINNVKVSFLYYEVPLRFKKIKFKKIFVADWRDILAEKFKTLSQRGSRKDFYDIYFSFKLKKISIKDGIKILKKRFEGYNINYFHILKSLVYFDDAEIEPELDTLIPVKWNEVKEFFIKNLKEFEKYLI